MILFAHGYTSINISSAFLPLLFQQLIIGGLYLFGNLILVDVLKFGYGKNIYRYVERKFLFNNEWKFVELMETAKPVQEEVEYNLPNHVNER